MPDQQQTPPPMGPPPPMQGNQQQAPPPGGNAPSFPQMPEQQEGGSESSIEEIEQVVETILDERWKEVTENIKKVLDWKNAMDEKFTKMNEEVKTLKEDFNELYKAIVGKVGEYDKNILKVDTELKALEKVFSQVLPNFTANVNELSRIAEDIKYGNSENDDERPHKKSMPKKHKDEESGTKGRKSKYDI